MTSKGLNHSYTHMGYGAGWDKFKSNASRANQFAKDNKVISKGFAVGKVLGYEPRTKIGKGVQNLTAQAGYGKKKKRQTGGGKVKVPKSITIKLG